MLLNATAHLSAPHQSARLFFDRIAIHKYAYNYAKEMQKEKDALTGKSAE